MRRFTFARPARAASTFVLAAALAGCSGVDQSDGSRRQTNASAPVSPGSAAGKAASAKVSAGQRSPIPQYPVGSASLDARFVGTVEIDGSCIYLNSGAERGLPVFPEGSVTWVKAGASFRFAGSVYNAGSAITVGGGEVRSPGGIPADARRFVVPPAPACDTSLMWFVAPA